MNRQTLDTIHSLFKEAIGEIDTSNPKDYIVESSRVSVALTNRGNGEVSKKSFLNSNKLREAFSLACPHKYDVDIYDLICLCLIVEANANKDWYLSVFLCEEIIDTTNNDYTRKQAVSLLTSLRKSMDIPQGDGYANDVLPKIENSSSLVSFFTMVKRRYAEIQTTILPQQNGTLSVELNAEAEYDYGDEMEFATVYNTGSLTINFSDISEYSNKCYNSKTIGSRFTATRLYFLHDKIVFEVLDTYNDDYIIKICAGKASCQKLTSERPIG